MFIDSHCHLNFADFDADRDEIIANAAAAGVACMVTISTELAKLPQLHAICDRYDRVFATVGIHPCHVHEEPETTAAELIAHVAGHQKIVGIGESGLDYFHSRDHIELQAHSFRAHIAASRELQIPLVIHCRDAETDILAMVETELAKGAFPFLMHCFAGSVEFAKQSLALGGYISFSGIVSFKNATAIHQVAQLVPEDRFLIETDSPYLAPAPMRGKRNQPAFVAHTAAAIAKLRDTTAEEIGKQSSDNFYRLFTRVPVVAARTASD